MTSLALLGGLAGAGRGISDVGRQMELDALEARRQQNLADIAAARDQSREDIAALRGGRAGSGSRSGSGGGGTGGNSLRDLMNDPEAMAFASGVDRGQIDDALAMAKGQKLTREVEGAQPIDEEGNVMEGPGAPETVDKYEPGKAAEVRMAGTTALRQAMKVADPKNADDLAKSERTDQGTKLAADYAKGNDRAGEAALINDSKPAFDDGSSNATGKTTAGSLADARAKERLADAGADKALADKRAAGGGGKGGKLTGDDETDRKILDGRSKTAGRDLVAADRALKLATENGDKEGVAQAKSAQAAARANLDEVKSAERDLAARREAKRTGATPAAKPEAKPEAAPPPDVMAQAKAAIAKNPANKAEVVRRLKAAGYSTAGI